MEDPSKPLSTLQFLRLTLKVVLRLDFFGEPTRLLTPLEIQFTRKRVLRQIYFWLAVGVVFTGLVGMVGVRRAGYSSFEFYAVFLGCVLFCVGCPFVVVLRVRADLAEGKAATVSGPVARRKISGTNRMFIEIYVPADLLPFVEERSSQADSQQLSRALSLQVVKAAYEQVSAQERVSVDYLPRSRVALRVCREKQEVPLWAADPSAPARWFR